MKKVLVIGGNSMVGSRFCELAGDRFEIVSIDKQDLDITNRDAVEAYFRQNLFGSVVNFSAYTDVAEAENQWNDKNGLTYKLNVLAPGYLSEALKKNNTLFVHFSTDFVFEGLENSKGPYDEDSNLPEKPDNLCWYGWTKNRGEAEIARSGVKNAIVRIANPFRSVFPPKMDFARKILDLYDNNNLFPLFTDQIITPIFIDDLVGPLSIILEKSLEGKFHLVSSDAGSYYDVGSYILEKGRGVTGVTQKASLVEFMKTPGRNKRPIFGGLATRKTQQRLGMKFKTWREMVDGFAAQLKT